MDRRGFLGRLSALLSASATCLAAKKCSCSEQPGEVACTISNSHDATYSLREQYGGGYEMRIPPGLRLQSSWCGGGWFHVDTTGCTHESVLYLTNHELYNLRSVYCSESDRWYHVCYWVCEGKMWFAHSGSIDRHLLMQEC
jgi:hypothetical protein